MNRPMMFFSLALCLALIAYAAWAWNGEQRVAFLPGATTHGHHQIELACERCHTPFEGVRQDVCVDCHGAELEAADDSHPPSKFEDPRNADRVAKLDARTCVTCHVEHRPALTGAMGLTLPGDYCYRCHDDIAEERPTHTNLAFDSCQSAGCHNFHDNRALHEDYLEQHLDEPDNAEVARLRLLVSTRPPPKKKRAALTGGDLGPAVSWASGALVAEWEGSAHAHGGVGCDGCHGASERGVEGWVERPGHEACAECHEEPVAGFLLGKHGMRLAESLRPMQPELAREPMRAEAHGRELGCNSCHVAHGDDRRRAAVEACLGCHADEHSLAYRASAHARLWNAELAGEAPEGTGVSCATCHLPRVESRRRGFTVQHNQNDDLRPNEKMIRPVCEQCHGVGFALDALADAALVRRNFRGRPTVHVESMAMVRAKLDRVKASRAQ